VEESPAGCFYPLAERRGAELTLALSRNSDASSMVSSAVCFSVDPSTPIIDHSIIFTCAMIVRDLKDYKERRGVGAEAKSAGGRKNPTFGLPDPHNYVIMYLLLRMGSG